MRARGARVRRLRSDLLAVLAAVLWGSWCPLPSLAGITVLCDPVDCMVGSDCGPSGTCANGDCLCTTDTDCPAGSECLEAEMICVTCPATPTPSATPTATETATASVTATATATSTGVPQGGGCATPSQCSTAFCVDGVCCDTICDQPGQVCNQPGNPGVCTAATAAAPALTPLALLIAVGLLTGLGAFALRRSPRRTPP